ncbi:RICIN domain-containing protein [Nocardiopsis sp. HUAS JQ3]|uniref:RICIN domain-containing protein n=1 Tax=Nocardiopsis sp. HUAS JQ3 TaxID=3061629 RepID=UPI0023A9A4F2|nr:RICIN domain-containing protein [Nocardiopsis sp. HUAS JQ3]WDZ93146.1 RICIN domain-containing protein [Nocardiopsis sp. HUAS JQ3]
MPINPPVPPGAPRTAPPSSPPSPPSRGPLSPASRLRRFLYSALAVVLCASGLSAAAVTPARAADIDTGAYYVLRNQHSGLVADVESAGTQDGARIIQWERTDRPWQQFRFVSSGDGYYRLVNRHSGKAVDVWEHSTANGAEIRQFTDLGNANQQWRPVDTGGGVQLINRLSGKALEVWEWSTTPGDRLSQYDSLGGANQVWDLVRVDGNGGGGDGDCGSGSHHAEAVQNGSTWTARNGGSTVYTGGDMLAAMRAAVGSLDPGRTSQQRVVVRGSGSMPANTSLDLPSHTSLEVCGTVHVSGSVGADHAAVRIRNAQNVSVPHLSVTGSPYFGVFVRGSQNVHFGRIDLRLSSGLGMRIDSRGSDANRTTRDISIDDVYVSGTDNHGVETYSVDGLDIGTVTARDTGYSGLLLNNTVNATVDRVDAEGAGTGTGYAAFRMANRNGRIGSDHPVNIRVGEVRARGGGRGVFCVSESGGAVIDRVDIAQTGNNAVLVENCHNVTFSGGTIAGPGSVRIAARSEFANTSNVTFQNLTLANTSLVENPCSVNLTVRNVTFQNSSDQTC